MFAYNLSQCRISYEMTVESPVFVGGAAKSLYKKKGDGSKGRGSDYTVSLSRTEENNSEINVTLFYPLLTASGKASFLIPASTLKGLLRSYGRDVLDDVLKEEKREVADPWQGREEFENIFIRQTFGTTDQKGLVAFSPALTPPIDPTRALYSGPLGGSPSGSDRNDFPLRLITQNKLDRVTMATTEGLRTFEALDAGIRLVGSFELRNFPWWAVGLLGIGIAGLNAGTIRIGGKAGVGFGKVSVKVTRIDLSYHKTVRSDGKIDKTIELPGIGRIVKDMSLELPLLRAALQDSKADDREGQAPPLFLLAEDDSITIPPGLHKANANPNPFYGDTMSITSKNGINEFFTQAFAQVEKSLDAVSTQEG
ncbi:MAG: hypothetical protein GXY80_11625 [Syntrophorhabdus aromaticivorans]|uniref:CRISPR type III-associated protein domain-containing protein n=1 Tax=Syntrophorhabdus aromaticivorans TaxID=328301 RepID=A0A971S146_9BACT|nr:hypothetical protein [Syntrophorhabdus aromaticivorans]